MKKLLPLLLLFAAMANAQTVTIPDMTFKLRLLSADINNATALDATGNPMKIDVNNDGLIQESEALAVYTLNLWDGYIMDLTGISSFTNLKNLDCHSNLITSIDLSGLPNITRINCSQNLLTSLNVSSLSNLSFLFCNQNQLGSLNVSGLSNLIFLSCEDNDLATINLTGATGLTALLCSNNQITSLNLNNLPQLTSLQCDYNQLTSLDVSNLTNLESLYCFYNQLSSLDVSNLANLETLSCGENGIATLNLNGLANLSSLECSFLPNNLTINGAGLNALTHFQYTGTNSTLSLNGFPSIQSMTFNLNQTNVTLNISGFNAQANLYMYNNPITSLTINGSGATNLALINCAANQLTSLSLNGLNNLSSLVCNNNKLTSLNLNGLTNLTSLNFGQNKISSIDLSNVPNLKHLDANNNKLLSLNVGGLSALEYLDCSNNSTIDIIGNQITSLNIGNLLNLKYLDCSNYIFDGLLGALGNQVTSLDVNNLIHMEQLKCSKNNIPSLVVDGLTNLKYLDCSYNHLTSLDLIGLTELTYLNYARNQLSNLNMVDLVNITELNCAQNNISTLNLLNMPNLFKLNCNGNLLTTLNLSGLNLITELYCDNNQIASLDVSGMPGLINLSCSANQLTDLQVNNLTNLTILQCTANHLTDLDVSALNNLTVLYCGTNELTSLNLMPLTNLIYLACDNNQITTLDVGTLSNLSELTCSHNQITNLNVSANPLLRILNCENNLIPSLNVGNLTELMGLYCNSNQLTTLDVSGLSKLSDLFCNNNLLTELFMKNGNVEYNLKLSENPLLTYICADEAELASVQSQLNTLGMTATVCNSYCSFTPGGPHNTVIGTTIFDGNNNGCNENDPLHPNIRVDFSDGTTTGSAFTNTNGICTFYAGAGNYTLFPNIENAAAFNISPASADINFPNNENNISNQSFCLSANGVHPDLEVVISPITPARPGFDATYEIVYKNKGNQVLSGNLVFTYDDSRMDLLTTMPAADTQTTGTLDWNYTGLLPFESRVIALEFNVNSPLEIPAVNNGDILNFTASITPTAGDETPLDNAFAFNQTTVGSFDPNDITCIQGAMVPPSEIGKYLHYIVNFENTGTASAVNIVVKIDVDQSKYDLHSLQVLNTSHASRTLIHGNTVEFIFENIELEAAADPPVGGHGNVLFKIKTLSSLMNGDQVEKSANIFFDYNAPIVTNDANTTFAELSNPVFEQDASVTLYPNPTNGIININCDNNIEQIELFDIQGRLLQTTIENKEAVKLNITDKSSGVYFVRITTENGKKVEKIIKE